MTTTPFTTIEHHVDFCVVGGGMAGLTAAVLAARHGARVVLVHDRPVLGGNASSEIRIHICGADRHGGLPNLRETGLLEDLRLENLRRNPNRIYSEWDLLLHETAALTPGLTVLYNCTCQAAEMDGARIASITGWQLTTQTYHTIHATLFADCSGDGVLAPLTGADFRVGREGRAEYGESIAPEIADRHTMGMTCLFQTREYDTPQPYIPPAWIHHYTDDDLPNRGESHQYFGMGYWWVELGGNGDSIADTEALRDELLKTALGVWDHIKNGGDHGAENWALEWLQFLPGKRESRRFLGDHVLCQPDVAAEGRFPDLVAYGGWSMDDHNTAGFYAARLGAPPTIFHACPSPFGIPYRALYSRNIDNLYFAGRNASCTHAAMSSTRVMGTGMSMGMAVGTAAAIAVRDGLTPRAVGEGRLDELQQTLLHDDAYLPWVPLRFIPAVLDATLTASAGDPSPVRDGINRPVGDDPHAWSWAPGDWVAYTFAAPTAVREVTLLLDSALDTEITLSLHYYPKPSQLALPAVLARALRLEGLVDGQWTPLAAITDNVRRHVRIPVNATVTGLRATLDATNGADRSRVYGFYFI